MSLLVKITEGWSQEIGPFTLRAQGDPVDLTGMTVALIVRSAATFKIVNSGRVRVASNQTTNPGQVFWRPEPSDFDTNDVDGPLYTFHWKVTDSAGRVVFFPNGDADTIRVAKS